MCQQARFPLVDKRCRTIWFPRMSLDSPSLDDKGADDHNLSQRAIRRLSLIDSRKNVYTDNHLGMSPGFRVSMTEIVGRPTKARLLLLHILNEELRPT